MKESSRFEVTLTPKDGLEVLDYSRLIHRAIARRDWSLVADYLWSLDQLARTSAGWSLETPDYITEAEAVISGLSEQ